MSAPTVVWIPIALAIFSFVPTPSALATRIGSRHRFRSNSNSAPNPPMGASTPRRKVFPAIAAIRRFASSAAEIFTPASEYRKGNPIGVCFLPGRDGTTILKRMEQPFPANFARVDNGIQIRAESVSDVPRVPDVIGRIDRHVDDYRRADDVRARHVAPEPAVVRILPVIAHHEIFARRNVNRSAIFQRVRRIHSVGFIELGAIDIDYAVLDLERVPRQPDTALDEIRKALLRQWRAKHDDLLPLRIPPQRHVVTGEWKPCVVPEPADNQVIPDQHGLFHRPARNHPRLHPRSFN